MDPMIDLINDNNIKDEFIACNLGLHVYESVIFGCILRSNRFVLADALIRAYDLTHTLNMHSYKSILDLTLYSCFSNANENVEAFVKDLIEKYGGVSTTSLNIISQCYSEKLTIFALQKLEERFITISSFNNICKRFGPDTINLAYKKVNNRYSLSNARLMLIRRGLYSSSLIL
jgi:hypothetical protein